MRGSGWLAPIAALIVWVLAVGMPACVALVELALGQVTGADPGRAWDLVLVSGSYALAVAAGAMLLGWIPGRVLGRSIQGGGFIPAATLMLAPICLPAYVIFYAWWQSWPADSWLYRWAAESGHLALARGVTLVLGMSCWSWPLVSWCVAGPAASTPASHDERLMIDGAGWSARLIERLRQDGRGLLIGGLLVFIVAFNNTICFDLAGIYSVGYELKALDAEGATRSAVLVAAGPAMALAGAGAVVVWLLLGGRPDPLPKRGCRTSRWMIALTAVVWVLSILVPLGLFARNLGGWSQAREFFQYYRWGLVHTVSVAAITGGLGALLAVGLALAWQDRRRWVRVLAHVQSIGWLLAAVVPATIVALALEGAYNRGWVVWPRGESAGWALGSEAGVSDLTLADVIYLRPAILVLGHLARFGVVAALLGRWLAVREPASLAELREVDGAQTLGGALRAARPRVLAAAIAAGAVMGVLSLSEVPVTGRLAPPGSDPLASSLLNFMHYQRPEMVVIASLLTVGAAVVAAALVAVTWRLVRSGAWRAVTAAILLGTACVALPACGPEDAGAARPLKTRLVFGSPGRGLGQFNYPRAIAADPQRERIYVVDKSARIQRFGMDGKPEHVWRMPEWENGKPTGLSVAPDGRIFVADTHYYRVVAYSPEGRELMRFGSYGEGPGQFIYPTDIAFGPEGRLYVSEYGGHDRIQVFTAAGESLFAFGSFGEGPDQFNRPQSMAFSADLSELYIADACNHRIVVVNPDGEWQRVFGGFGREAGKLAYPYDLMVLEDGTLLVCEFGNNRIQRFSRTGACLGVWGRLGRAEGELQYPWGIARVDDQVFIVDSGNNRVQRIRSPS